MFGGVQQSEGVQQAVVPATVTHTATTMCVFTNTPQPVSVRVHQCLRPPSSGPPERPSPEPTAHAAQTTHATCGWCVGVWVGVTHNTRVEVRVWWFRVMLRAC